MLVIICLYNLQLVQVSAAILHIQVKWPILLLLHDFLANNDIIQIGTGDTQQESIGPKSLGATNLLQIGFH